MRSDSSTHTTSSRLDSLRCGLAACVILAGCASTHGGKPGVVNDQIGAEFTRAIAERHTVEPDRSLMPPLAVELPKENEPRFDLSVVNAPATQVFMAIVNGTRYNMLIGPDVSGQVTVNLKNVTVLEALDSIRELYGYEYQIKGNRISIQPNTLQTRMFQINYLASRRQGSTELSVTSSAAGGGMPSGSGTASSPAGAQAPIPAGSGQAGGMSSRITSQVQTRIDNNFWDDLKTALGTLVGNDAGNSVVVNPISGVIVIRAMPREIRAVETYLKATQVVVERQVMLEAKIVQVTLKDGYQTGVNWAAFGNAPTAAGGVRSAIGSVNAGTALNTLTNAGAAAAMSNADVNALAGRYGSIAAAATGNGFIGLAFQTANFAALMNFLETQGNVSVLSSPRIATLNNQKAVLKVGTDDLFVTNVTTNTTSTAAGTVSTPSLTLQSYFSGISLDVTPQIDEDNNIILHVHPAVSQVTEKQKVIDLGATLGVYKLPLASSSVNETDSIVRVQDGNIVAIGGLMTQEQTADRSGLPGTTGSAAGALFGQRSASYNKQELVILIKPTVIVDDKPWVRDLEATSDRLRGMGAPSPAQN
ncbi:MAG: secretin N-terminal domain-containing protein [Proteobacteria bacterium]|nr:secretin N-terminal domain-containing protein [Pseudomonadota bacterium]